MTAAPTNHAVSADKRASGAEPDPRAHRERVAIYDTTLRDGLQPPGISLDAQQRLKIALQLEQLGVDAIEAGFPAIGRAELAAVAMVAREVHGPIIKALARARTADVDSAWEAVREAQRPRIVIFVPVSDQEIRELLHSTRERVMAITTQALVHARSLVDDVELSPMDATRADQQFLAELVAAAIEHGATVISIPDTYGYALPNEFAAQLQQLAGRVPTLASVTLAVHCHNDIGLAVANSLAAVTAGASAVECTINGLGERAGNASLEELAMAIEMRGETLARYTDIDTRRLVAISQLVAQLTGYSVAPNKAVVGRNAFPIGGRNAVQTERSG